MEQENITPVDNSPANVDDPSNIENLPTLTSFQFTPQFMPFFDRLTTAEEWQQMLKALCAYAFEGKELPLTGTVLAIFSFAKDEIDNQRRRVALIANSRSKAGKEGALALYRKRLRAMARKEKRRQEKELAKLQQQASESTVVEPQSTAVENVAENVAENVDNQTPLT